MELFKTTGVLDETVLKEVAKQGISKSEKRATIFCFVLCLVFSAARYSAFAAICFSTGLFLVLWQRIIFKRITIKNNLRNIQEFNGVSGYQYTTWFDENGVTVLNLTNHGEGKYRYAYLSRIFETEHVLALQVKNRKIKIDRLKK